MRISDALFRRIGVSCIGGNRSPSDHAPDLLREWEERGERAPLEVPAFGRPASEDSPVYSVHAYKELFVEEPAFVRYYLGRLWKYMDDVNSGMAVFHPAQSVLPSVLGADWFRGDISVGFENVNEAVFQYAEFFRQESRFGIVLDTAHAMRLGIPIAEYLHYRIIHVHIRGWDKRLGYQRIKPQDPYIADTLTKLLQSGYQGMFILEYPYHSLAEWKEDRDILKKILEETVLS